MKNLLLPTLLLAGSILHAQLSIEWQKQLGGSNVDQTTYVISTNDGGYLVTGLSMSDDGDLNFNHSSTNFDAWLVKLKADGTIQWQKCMGGSSWDYVQQVQQTSDGGFILIGSTDSYDGDLALIKDYNKLDVWVAKLKPNGQQEWAKTYGSGFDDIGRSIHPTADGGYLVGGTTLSSYWLFKIDSGGKLLWEKQYGGSGDEQLQDMQVTSDQGCIMTGSSWSGDVPGHHGTADFGDYLVIKTDNLGNVQWQKSLGGTYLEQSNCVVQTQDGGYMVSGFSYSNDGDVSGHHGTTASSSDPWIVKLDNSGKISWQKCLGGQFDDMVWHMSLTNDGNVIIGGMAASKDGTLPNSNKGMGDAWLLKMGLNGTTKWQQLFGSSDFDQARAVAQTLDGGFIFSGYTGGADGDVTKVTHGGEDIWVVKLGANTAVSEPIGNILYLYPNPATENVHLTAPADDPIVAAFITDLSGTRMLPPQTIRPEDLVIAALPAGAYLVHAETKSGKHLLGKVIKHCKP